MGRSRNSEVHHHRLEAIGAGMDHAFHPFSSYARSHRSQTHSVAGPAQVTYVGTPSGHGRGPRPGHPQPPTNFTIPCHHVRTGDIVYLQKRPCQLIRITTSAATGQHRYMGVDLYTGNMLEEPCVVSHPSPNIISHAMSGPVYQQYRILDIDDNNKLICQTETGEIKTGLRCVDQGKLKEKIKAAYGSGSGSVRAIVLNDGGDELVVDYKIQHLGQKL